MLIPNKKQKCKEKLILTLVSFVIIITFCIAIPPLFIVFIFIIIKKRISIEKIIKSTWFHDCIKVFLWDKKYIKELAKKRYKKEENKKRKKESFREILNKKNGENSFINTNIKNSYNKKELKKEKPKNKQSNKLSFNDWKSIWDDYTSILDDFKK